MKDFIKQLKEIEKTFDEPETYVPGSILAVLAIIFILNLVRFFG
jgi:hypothetical protein